MTLNSAKVANISLFTEFGDYTEKQCIIKERYPAFDKKRFELQNIIVEYMILITRQM